MTPADAHDIRAAIAELRDAVATVEKLQREANHRVGKLESRVFELELWRARWQGAAATSRGAWLVVGGAATAVAIEIFRNL
jgi:hypothetical protein